MSGSGGCSKIGSSLLPVLGVASIFSRFGRLEHLKPIEKNSGAWNGNQAQEFDEELRLR
jgi:hypothetical protein